MYWGIYIFIFFIKNKIGCKVRLILLKCIYFFFICIYIFNNRKKNLFVINNVNICLKMI